MLPEIIKFTVGQSLKTRSIGDSDCVWSATVLNRTEKTITISGTFSNNRPEGERQ
jgi:hypothetical protein